ncbi:MAG: 16S rRNA (guanine(527)-N(7))-methyltransferase RsmG, partial [Desulfatitalea sp.]|nr:16S rRNA (guanine(527)-N(7))-methyltransferase RsmG [Desulfatitalea sp.]
MQVESEAWRTLLAKGALEMGLQLDPTHIERMGLHAQALLEWNRTINLTAITDPVEIAVKHFLDAIVPSAHIPLEGELLDIGTGGGFPGIPLKILRPDQPMTLIDGSRKKINFVKHVIRHLGLEKIKALQTRAELLGDHPEGRGRFNVVVCRAVSDLPAMARLALPLLAPQGKLFLYQGPSDAPRRMDDSAVLGPDMAIIAMVEYRLPMLGDRRILVVAGKTEGGT